MATKKKPRKKAPKKTAQKKGSPPRKPRPTTKKKQRLKQRRAKKPSTPARKPKRAANPQRRTPAAGEAQAEIDRGMDLLDRGEIAEAAAAFLSAGRLAPDDWRLPNEAGICFYRLERYEEAVRCYEQALAIDPKRLEVLLNKGLALVLSDRDAEALQAFGAVFSLDPVHPGAHFEIGKIFQKQGRHEDAFAHFETALAHEIMQTMFEMTGGRPRNTRLVSLIMLNKARLLLGPLARPGDGLAQVKTLWDTVADDSAILRLAEEMAAERPDLARQVLDVLLAAQPQHDAARALRDRT